jgi:hypothetical protein
MFRQSTRRIRRVIEAFKRPAEESRSCIWLINENREIWNIFKDIRRTNVSSNVLANALTSIPRSIHGTDLPLRLKKEISAQNRLWNYLTALDRAAKKYKWEDKVVRKLWLLAAWKRGIDLDDELFFSAFEQHEKVLEWLAPLKHLWRRTIVRWRSGAVADVRFVFGAVRYYLNQHRAKWASKRLSSPCCGVPYRPSRQRKRVDVVFRLVGLEPFRCRKCHSRFYR